MRHNKRAHRVLVVDGDQAHFEQGLDAFQFTEVRLLHSDGDFALVWEQSVGEHSGHVCKCVGMYASAWYQWLVVLHRERV